MKWQYTSYMLPLIVAAGVSVAIVIISWRRRTAPGALPLAILTLAVAEWSIGYVLELGGGDLSTKIFWGKVEYLGIVTLPVAWLAFALQFSNQGKWLTRRNLVLLALVPSITLLLIWTNQLHGLVWRDIALDASGPFLALDVSYGFWFWVNTAYAYVLLLTGTVLVIRMLVRSSNLYRRQAGMLLIGLMAPWVSNGIYLFDLTPIPNLDLTPFAFTLSGLALASSLFLFRLLDIVPVARWAVVDSMSDGVIVLDTQNRIVDLNPAARRIIGKTITKIIGQTAAAVLAQWPDLVERYHDTMQTQTEIIIERSETQQNFDMQISPLYDRHQRLTGRLIVLRDITERKRTEKELRRQALTFENISDSVILTNMDGLIIDANSATGKIFGYTKAEALGKSPAMWHLPGKYMSLKQEIIDRIAQEGRWMGELNFIRKDDSKGICEAIIVPLRDENGRQIATIGVSRDITERKQAEEALLQAKEAAKAANRAKSVFLANMGHELRTPLTVMIGYSEMLQDEAVDSGYANFVSPLEKVQASGNHLLALINNILDISKIEAGKMDLAPRNFDLSILIDDVAIFIQPLIDKNGNSLQIERPTNLGFMHTDQLKVRQALLNLLNNAAKFTEQGQITLAITRETANGVDWVNFEITDTGIGMAPKQVAHLFQPFTQADDTTTRKYGGTGLGLAISRRFCQMMGGDITVRSEIDQGSTFNVRLPADTAILCAEPAQVNNRKTQD